MRGTRPAVGADIEQAAEHPRLENDLVSEGAALHALADPFSSRYVGRADEEMRRAQRALEVAERVGDTTLGREPPSIWPCAIP
jgi:hypothetical protein